MPLSLPTQARTPQHMRQVSFRSFEREDGLWDIEGELLDSKAVDTQRGHGLGLRKAGEPIHHMRIRVTINTQLVVQAIEAAMDAHPIEGCPDALDAMQRMVGCSMARGWRAAINTHLAGVAGCTHMRELLQNMATAAFQSIVSAFSTEPELPAAYLGRCTGWDFDGPAVAKYHPQFVGWILPEGKGQALPPPLPVTSEKY